MNHILGYDPVSSFTLGEVRRMWGESPETLADNQ